MSGLRCPNCNCADLRDVNGRPWDVTKTEKHPGYIRRRRICRNCGKSVYTRERIEKQEKTNKTEAE